MPVTYEIRAEESIVVATYSGTVTPDQVIASFRTFRQDPEFSLALTHLVDVSQVTRADVGFSEIFSLFSTFARTYSATGTTMRSAIFAPTEFAFGLARIFENLSETSADIECRVFDRFDDALAWARRPEGAEEAATTPGETTI